MQSRLGSLVEVITGTAIGYLVALLAQVLIFPLYGLQAGFSENVQIAALFTVVSLIRSYCVRRLFNLIASKRLRRA